jgi:hypothetical protein
VRGAADRATSDRRRSSGSFRLVCGCIALSNASATIERETVDLRLPSVEEAVQRYAKDFGPFVIARGVLEPQDRWVGFLQVFADLIRRFNPASDGTAKIRSDYFVIRVER